QRRSRPRHAALARPRGANLRRHRANARPPARPADEVADAAALPRHRGPPAFERGGSGGRRVVETTIGRPRRLLAPAAALLAVGLLIVMIVAGHPREDRQFVKFAPGGAMRVPPEEIDRVEMTTSAGRWAFVRAPDGWRGASDGQPVPSALASRLQASIKVMDGAVAVRG